MIAIVAKPSLRCYPSTHNIHHTREDLLKPWKTLEFWINYDSTSYFNQNFTQFLQGIIDWKFWLKLDHLLCLSYVNRFQIQSEMIDILHFESILTELRNKSEVSMCDIGLGVVTWPLTICCHFSGRFVKFISFIHSWLWWMTCRF